MRDIHSITEKKILQKDNMEKTITIIYHVLLKQYETYITF